MTLPIMCSEMGITELRRLTLRHDTSPYNNCSIALSKCCSWWDFLYTIVARRLRATTWDRISTSPCFASYSESYWGGGWSLKFLVPMEYYLVWNGMHTPTRRAVLFVSLECCCFSRFYVAFLFPKFHVNVDIHAFLLWTGTSLRAYIVVQRRCHLIIDAFLIIFTH